MRKLRLLTRANTPAIVLGALIAMGAGLGMVAGLLFGNMVLGMIYGAGIGTVVGAVYEMWWRSVARENGKQAG